MRNTAKNAKAALSLAAVIASTSLMSSAFAADEGYKLITDRKALFDQIYDPTKKNPNSFMPPFGAFNIISDAEINTIMDYLYKH